MLFETHHCVTGSLRRIYAHYGHDISEDLLLGLGEGVGFIYWHIKNSPPFIGGRAQPKPSLEAIVTARTGVTLTEQSTTSARKAEATLRQHLTDGTPVMLQVDMGYLPYFDFGGTEFHFGGHVVVATGLEGDTVLIADRDSDLHRVPMAALGAARGSTHKPFPPQNRWLTADLSTYHEPSPAAILEAIRHQAEAMLNPPIRNLGVAGIRTAAERVVEWQKAVPADELALTLFNTYLFISPVGGTGGGAFRVMFSRFLHEAAIRTEHPALHDHALAFERIAAQWEAVGEACKVASESGAPAGYLPELSAALSQIAEAEQVAWGGLQ